MQRSFKWYTTEKMTVERQKYGARSCNEDETEGDIEFANNAASRAPILQVAPSVWNVLFRTFYILPQCL